jgi:hypothetical protein
VSSGRKEPGREGTSRVVTHTSDKRLLLLAVLLLVLSIVWLGTVSCYDLEGLAGPWPPCDSLPDTLGP